MSEVALRPADIGDIPTLFDLRLSVGENAMDLDELARAGITPESIATALGSKSRAWIVDVDGRPTAFAMADAGEGTVFAMFVRPGFESLGLGRALMAQAEAFLFLDHATIWLTTGANPNLRAHGFYRRLGWREVGFAADGQRRYEKDRP